MQGEDIEGRKKKQMEFDGKIRKERKGSCCVKE